MQGLLETHPGLIALQIVYEREVWNCTRCPLHERRQRVMFGNGQTEHPDVAFIGERPTVAEELGKQLFAGENAALLRRGLDVLKLDSDRMYFLHAVCCRPRAKQVATNAELAACNPIMRSQVLAVQPKLIVCLGKSSAQSLLGTDLDLSELRGKWHKFDRFDVRVTYALDQVVDGNEEIKSAFWIDLKAVKKRLKDGRS